MGCLDYKRTTKKRLKEESEREQERNAIDDWFYCWKYMNSQINKTIWHSKMVESTKPTQRKNSSVLSICSTESKKKRGIHIYKKWQQ